MSRKDLQPNHDGGSSSTQDSVRPTGSPGTPYRSGANVHKGGGPKPSAPAPASQPKGQDY
jgi:hypothetical protein